MKKAVLNLLFAITPALLFGQWNQMGSSLEGEFDGDTFGRTLSINYQGDAMIVGTHDNPNFAGNTAFPGMARVFDWNGTGWVQRGDDIDGTTDEWSGYEVEIDSAGNTIAITSIYGDNDLGYRPGLVRIYDWNGTNWIQRGDEIEGDGAPVMLEWFGKGLSLSADGNTIGIGGPNNITNGFRAGFAKIFNWDGTQWVQVGNTILGDEEYDTFGMSLSLSADGTKAAIGAPGNLGYGNNEEGYMKVLEFNGTDWIQMGTTIYGDFDGDDYGRSISLNSAGNRVAVGAPRDNSAGPSTDCKTYAYEWNGSNWMQMGSTLVGEQAFNNFGFRVRLNSTGDRLASSASTYFTNGDIQVFEWASNTWTQLGNNLTGDNPQDIFGAGMDMNGTGNRVAGGAYGHDDKGQAKVYEFQSDAGIVEGGNIVEISVFPNPTYGTLHLQNVEESLEIELSDLNGKSILGREIVKDTQIDLSELPAGVYILKIEHSKGNQLERIVKQ